MDNVGYCDKCGKEVGASNLVNHSEQLMYCKRCERNYKAKIARHAREEAYKSCGMVKVKGALGGTYWE